jgi:hypothetical protein
MFGISEQASPISEGAMEIQINSQPIKGINLTTRHKRARRASWVATVHDVIKEMIRAHLTLVHVFHVIPRWASMGGPHPPHPSALSWCTPIRYGSITSISVTHDATKFAGPQKIPYAPVHNQSLFIRTQPTWALINIGGGYHLGGLNLWFRPLSTFPSSILHFPLIAPPDL